MDDDDILVMSQLQVHHMRTSSNKQIFHQIYIIYYENMKTFEGDEPCSKECS